MDDGTRSEKLKPVVLTPVFVPEPKGLRLRTLMIAIAVCGFGVWMALENGRLVIVAAVLFVIVGSIGLAVVLARRNASQQEAFLLAMSIAAERSMPLSPAALAFADQFGATFRWRVQLFASLLDEGLSFPEAMDRIPNLLSREARVLVRAGWSSGRFAEGLREAAAVRVARQTIWASVGVQFAYIGGVLLVLQIVVGFIMYFIAPRYEAIFYDFGLPLPAVTRYTLETSHFFLTYFPITILLLLAEVTVFLVVPLGFMNVFQWDLPPLDWLFRRRHSTLILRALALSVEGDKSITSGIESLLETYPSTWVRDRLRVVRHDLQRGEDWIRALQRRGLINDVDAAVVASASKVGNLAWALRETSESTERRLGYRLQFALQTLFPIALLGVGAIVMVICAAYFYPIVILIERLSG